MGRSAWCRLFTGAVVQWYRLFTGAPGSLVHWCSQMVRSLVTGSGCKGVVVQMVYRFTGFSGTLVLVQMVTWCRWFISSARFNGSGAVVQMAGSD